MFRFVAWGAKEQSFEAAVKPPKQQEATLPASLYLVRHGSHGDLGARLTGRGEERGLTPAGRAEAEGAAAILAAEPVQAVYASPRQRTIETARIIAAPHGLPVRLAAGLDEIDFGEWTGRSFAELDGTAEWDRWNARRSEARCPGGESMAEAQARAVATAFEIAARHEGAAVLVTHCDIIRALMCWQQRRSLDDILSFEAPPASITELTIVADALEPA